MLANLPPVTRALLLTNVGVFLLQYVTGPVMLQWLALWPPGTLFEPWQLVTYAFLHDGLAHIFFNMFALFMFGPPLERFWGSSRFTVFYFVCVLAAGLTQQAASSACYWPSRCIFRERASRCCSRRYQCPRGYSSDCTRCLRCTWGSRALKLTSRISRIWVACWAARR
jgi:hypothetical protein